MTVVFYMCILRIDLVEYKLCIFHVILGISQISVATYFMFLCYYMLVTFYILIISVSPLDYEVLSTTLMFAACETRRCVDVSIVDDVIVEPIETFAVTLERTPDLDSMITLNPVEEEINVIDNDCKQTILNIK